MREAKALCWPEKKDLKSCEPQSCCCDKPNKFQLTSKNELGRSRRTPFVIILRIFRNIVESWLLDYSFFADIAPEIRASKVETSFGQSGPCKRKHFSSKTIEHTASSLLEKPPILEDKVQR